MSKFNVGDIVRVTEDHNNLGINLVKGDILLITASDHTNIVDTKTITCANEATGLNFSFYYDKFELDNLPIMTGISSAITTIGGGSNNYTRVAPTSTLVPEIPVYEAPPQPDWCPYKQYNDKYNLEEP